MSHAGIAGMRCAADDIVAVSSGLSKREWQMSSAGDPTVVAAFLDTLNLI